MYLLPAASHVFERGCPGMRVLVVRNVVIEGPGMLGGMLASAGHALDLRCMESGDALPDTMGGYEALVVLGGPMNAYEEDAYPHLRRVGALLVESLGSGRPTLGFCLGAQLMAKALGAVVRANPVKEIGVYHVELMDPGARDPIFAGVPARAPVFQWHGDTFDLPAGAVLLATSPACRHQAFRYGQRAYGFQFHWEVDEAMVDAWARAYREELAAFDGSSPGALVERFRAAAEGVEAAGRRIGTNVLRLFE